MDVTVGLIFEFFALMIALSIWAGYYIVEPKKLLDWVPFIFPVLSFLAFATLGFNFLFGQ